MDGLPLQPNLVRRSRLARASASMTALLLLLLLRSTASRPGLCNTGTTTSTRSAFSETSYYHDYPSILAQLRRMLLRAIEHRCSSCRPTRPMLHVAASNRPTQANRHMSERLHFQTGPKCWSQPQSVSANGLSAPRHISPTPSRRCNPKDGTRMFVYNKIERAATWKRVLFVCLLACLLACLYVRSFSVRIGDDHRI